MLSCYRSKPKGSTDDPGVTLCKSVRGSPFSSALRVTTIFVVCCLAALPWCYALCAFLVLAARRKFSGPNGLLH